MRYVRIYTLRSAMRGEYACCKLPHSQKKHSQFQLTKLSAFQLNGNVSDYLVDLGRFLGQKSHDFPGLII